MIKLIHKKGKHINRVLNAEESISANSEQLAIVFWELAEKYPEEIIAWCEEEFEKELNTNSWQDVFHHDLIMASYALKSVYLPDAVGYIDQLPFVNINREVQYATWRMSTDVGGITGEVLLKFRKMFGHIKDFGLLLNSIAKLGQQNGLFCYSAPQLVMQQPAFDSNSGNTSSSSGLAQPDILDPKASSKELFSFVYSHYKSIRLWLLFWCFMKYEKSIPLEAFLGAFFYRKCFKKEVDLSGIAVKSLKPGIRNTIDVIIPSLGRREYLLQVLDDLKVQTLLPKKVIVVEQNPQPDSQTELPELKTQDWPFEMVHHFTHQTGACNARNLALEEVDAEWVFFADDDNRMENDVLEKSMQKIKSLVVDLLTLKYSKEGDKLIFDKVKQWGTFGAGNSLVSGKFASQLRFDMDFENGYG